MCPRAVHERVAAQLDWHIVDRRPDIPTGDQAPTDVTRSERAALRSVMQAWLRALTNASNVPNRPRVRIDQPGVFLPPSIAIRVRRTDFIAHLHPVLRIDAH